MDVELARESWYLTSETEPRKVLKKFKNKRYKMVKQTIGSKTGYKWWFTKDYLQKSKTKFGIETLVPLSRRITEFLERNRLKFSKMEKTEILQEILSAFPGSKLPDLKTITDMLKSHG
ncbi:hypothetical protein GF325_09550 [Candidatus Bathyarchaeota archaeon]|nr:hypothetical protein [Candidatus Bathyarchaeota archaeon]